nr:glycosyltransferase family 4 protein [Nakamurella flavida]
MITNDFPPRTGGIQSYVHALTREVPPDALVVYAPAWPGAQEFDAAQPYPVHRHPTSLMLPGPAVRGRARELVTRYGCQAAWFGAAAPLALLGPSLRDVGIRQVVASTHGHEVGWSMLPASRQALGRIGRTADVVTFVSRYARSRIAAALGPDAALESLPPGVDTGRFRPDPDGRARIRARHGLTDGPVIVCVSRLVRRKGQDVLVRALPRIRTQVPAARLLIVGDGDDRARLTAEARRCGVTDAVVFTGAVPFDELPAYYAAGDVFAMPCRTRGGGLDVEGLGIVFLEASAVGLPVVAGDAGGAPETVRAGETGEIVDGRDVAAVTATLVDLLADPDRCARLGAAGRRWVEREWTWPASGRRLADLLSG